MTPDEFEENTNVSIDYAEGMVEVILPSQVSLTPGEARIMAVLLIEFAFLAENDGASHEETFHDH